MREQQLKNEKLHAFVTNLQDLYIELLMNDAIKSAKREKLKHQIDIALENHDHDAFNQYTNELIKLEA